jgi:hypothetical protein
MPDWNADAIEMLNGFIVQGNDAAHLQDGVRDIGPVGQLRPDIEHVRRKPDDKQCTALSVSEVDDRRPLLLRNIHEALERILSIIFESRPSDVIAYIGVSFFEVLDLRPEERM